MSRSGYPSLAQQIYLFGIAAVQHIRSGLKNVDDTVQQKRLQICSACPSNINGTCQECGCFIQIKTRWIEQECPQQKWGPALDPQDESPAPSNDCCKPET